MRPQAELKGGEGLHVKREGSNPYYEKCNIKPPLLIDGEPQYNGWSQYLCCRQDPAPPRTTVAIILVIGYLKTKILEGENRQLDPECPRAALPSIFLQSMKS